MKKYILFIFLPIAIIIQSCDPSGNILITNGYPFTVNINAVYDYNGEEKYSSFILDPNISFAPAARNIEYNKLKAIQILRGNNIMAEYTPEYVVQIKMAYLDEIKKRKVEIWIFTEKGLFFETLEVSRKYKFDKEKILEYYCSDDAINELEERLKSIK
jgi:hypothetical protein